MSLDPAVTFTRSRTLGPVTFRASQGARLRLGALASPAWLAACLGPGVTLGALQAWGQALGIRITCRLARR